MILASIEASALNIPFKTAFKHSSAERSSTETLWVEAKSASGQSGNGEGCPRSYVTKETLETALAFIARHRGEWLRVDWSVGAIQLWVKTHREEIDVNPAAWCAVELALFDLLGKRQGQSVEALLDLPEMSGSFQYTAVLGDASPQAFKAQIAPYQKAGFRDYKIKLSGNAARDRAKVELLQTAGIALERVRADANNLWGEAADAIAFFRVLNCPFFAIEEPLRPGDHEGMRRIAEVLDTTIILDESALRTTQLEGLDDPDRFIVNVRVSKLGGLLRSLDMTGEARRKGMRIVVGAHVGETSLLTRAALSIANCSRDILMAQEGAFGTHLLSRDPAVPMIMFGVGGVLEAKALFRAPGFGLTFAE